LSQSECRSKRFFRLFQKQIKESEYGTDVQSVKVEYERHQKEHKIIDQVKYFMALESIAS